MSKKEDTVVEMKSDSEDSEDEVDQEEEENKKKLESLNSTLAQDPYSYQSHVDKIDVLKNIGDLEELRKARQKFSELFPLSPELWISWLKDEQGLVATDEDREMVFKLFEKAVKDYVSVELWLEYCQFSLCGLATEEGVKRAREIFERAISSVGIHMAKGSLIWEAYREFEAALLSLAAEDDKKKAEQKEKIKKLFQRQLTVPMLDMEATLAEFKTFEDGQYDRSSFQKTKKMLEAREPFENLLLQQAGKVEEQLETYSEYIQLELKEGLPARIQNLYERRITDHCLIPLVWKEYLDYLTSKLKVPEQIFLLHERSVRNCPWDSELWVSYIRNGERFEKPTKFVNEVFETALGSVFADPGCYLKIWQSYLDFRWRRHNDRNEEDQNNKGEKEKGSSGEISVLFGKAVEHLAGIGGDPECKIARFWGTVEGDHFKNMEEARTIWSNIVTVLAEQSKYWIEYINLEKLCGDAKHLRRLFPKALEKCTDWPEVIGEVWLQFEREEGTLDDFENAERKVVKRVEKIAVVRKLEQEVNQAKMEKRKEKDKDKRRDKRHQESDRKRKVVEQQSSSDGPPPESKKFKSNAGESDDGFKVPPPPGFKKPAVSTDKVQAPPGFKEARDENPETRTVFVSNLSYDVDEKQLEGALKASGEISEVRLIKKPSGKSKGFAYVVFASKSGFEKALGRDKEPLAGRPMFISYNDPEKKSKGHDFKYAQGLEKNKLFVKGMPVSYAKEDIEELFKPYGAIKDVRLVVYRNGHSKGIAFVEFENESDASSAIIKTDGMKLENREISVALSNPPERKATTDQSPPTKSLGNATRVLKEGPKAKMAFLPAALRNKKPAATATVSASSTSSAENGSKNGSSAAKTNDDFRKLLLKK